MPLLLRAAARCLSPPCAPPARHARAEQALFMPILLMVFRLNEPLLFLLRTTINMIEYKALPRFSPPFFTLFLHCRALFSSLRIIDYHAAMPLSPYAIAFFIIIGSAVEESQNVCFCVRRGRCHYHCLP